MYIKSDSLMSRIFVKPARYRSQILQGQFQGIHDIL